MNFNENAFIPTSIDYEHEMVPRTKDWVMRLNPDSKLPNFNTGRLIVPESQVVNESLKPTKASTNLELSNDFEAESITPIPPLNILLGASPSSEEEVFDDEEVTQVKVLMALADDELTVGKIHAHNGK
nr:hypothetical protein [Tanacetum cinerariifolium]